MNVADIKTHQFNGERARDRQNVFTS